MRVSTVQVFVVFVDRYVSSYHVFTLFLGCVALFCRVAMAMLTCDVLSFVVIMCFVFMCFRTVEL